MKLEKYDIVYFLGIGGIGMSALARWFIKSEKQVFGYDKTPTTLTAELEQEGMIIHFQDQVENIPTVVKEHKSNVLVIFTPAIPKDHKEHEFLRVSGYTILKRSEVLGLITKDFKTIAVAGTHGKTTTSSMIAHILKQAGKNMVAFLGGVTTNYASNLVIHGEVNEDTIVVVEADEFDRSFLRLFPNIAVVTSADPDHLDIYGDHQSLLQSFKEFIGQLKNDGSLIINESIVESLLKDETIDRAHIYGMSQGQFFTSHITVKGGFFNFNLCGFTSVENVTLGVPGFHNVENAVAASVASYLCDVDLPTIVEALDSYRGVKRRFEFVIRTDQVAYIDDYAHHPTEIRAFLRSVRELYPGKKLTVIFQPHLYTRTRDFAEGFSETLSLADELILLEIYPAREAPIPGVDAGLILKKVTCPVKIECNKDSLMEILQDRVFEVLVTVGAGDIDTFVHPIKKLLEDRYEKV